MTLKLPIKTWEVDHEVVVIDLFEDADGLPVKAQDLVDAVNAGHQPQPPPDLEARLTAAVREADLEFEAVGGSSRHYVCECLLPALGRVKLKVVDT